MLKSPMGKIHFSIGTLHFLFMIILGKKVHLLYVHFSHC